MRRLWLISGGQDFFANFFAARIGCRKWFSPPIFLVMVPRLKENVSSLQVGNTVIDALALLNSEFPTVDPARLKELAAARRALLKK